MKNKIKNISAIIVFIIIMILLSIIYVNNNFQDLIMIDYIKESMRNM